MENYLEINYQNNMKMLAEAINYCAEKMSHEDIIFELQAENDLKKQLCLIELKKIQAQKEADILVYNLINHSGPIRETTSYKILDLISNKNFEHFFQTNQIIDILTKAITDINPTVSRNAVYIIKYIKNVDYLYLNIVEEINKTLSMIDMDAKNRSYVQNKKNFNLYWNLEAIINIVDFVQDTSELVPLIKNISESRDYTIREKCAKLATILSEKNSDFKKISNTLKNDENIYVRRNAN